MPYAQDQAGNWWEVDAQGNPLRPAQSAAAPTVVAPNPARAAQQQQQQNNEAERLRLAQAAEARANAAAERASLEWTGSHNPDGTPRQIRNFRPMPDSVARRYEDAINGFAALDRTLGTFNDDFAGNTVTGGLENSIQSRVGSFGTPGQAQWWSDQASVDNVLRNALFGASLTAGEQAAWERTTVNPSMDPNEVRTNLQRRRELAQGILQRRTAFLNANGYDPEAVGALAGEYGQELVRPAQQQPTARQQAGRAWEGIDQATSREGQQQVATRGYRDDPPTDAERRTAAELNAMFRRGASVGEIQARARELGLTGAQFSPAAIGQAVQQHRQWNARNSGRRSAGPFEASANRVPTTIWNNVAAHPVTTTFATGVDAATIGTLSRLRPNQMEALRETNPNAAMLGEGLGAVGGTAALGRLGANVAGRFAPSLLGGGRASRMGRMALTDTAYGAALGDAQADDPLGGAVAGLAGSMGGQGLGAAAGGLFRGVTRSPASRELADLGVTDQTFGQQAGGMTQRFEDRLVSTPIVGDMLRNRRMEGFENFNRAAMNVPAERLGGAVPNIGQEGIGQLDDLASGAFDAATAGRVVPVDDVYRAARSDMNQTASMLPPRFRPDFRAALANSVDPATASGELTGEGFQQASRALRGYRSGARGPGFEKDFRDSLSGAQGALTDLMRRGGGDDVVEGLDRAGGAYRDIRILDDAVTRARNGTRTGEAGVFSPSQLNDAVYASNRRFPGNTGLARLAEAGQRVLPSSIPDSGTAGRLAQIGLPGFLGGSVGLTGGGAMSGSETMTGAGAASLSLAGLLAMASSKSGQRILSRALLRDQDGLGQRIGRGIFGAGRVGGRAAIPYLIGEEQ